MRPKWLVEIEAQIRRLYEAVNLRDDLWPVHPPEGQIQTIVITPGKILFTLTKDPKQIKPTGAYPPQ
jgi:hypothetical protein